MKSSIVLVKMVASALWNVTRGNESDVAPLRNDVIFASCLHLITKSGWVEELITLRYSELCILKHFETHADVISWRARLQEEHASKMAENEDAEKKRLDKRREEAKARRDQIKAKFNTDELDDMGNDADKSGVVEEKEQVWAYPHGTCIVCQEATDKDGILSWLM
jgi:hypothetical protein